jgi:diguanylate cyclase (GGDEF)-like protein
MGNVMNAAVQTNDRSPAWFDLRRRDIRDAVTVLALSSAVLCATAGFAAFKYFSHYAGDERLQFMAVTFVLLACCLIAIAFGCRRLQDLRGETRLRQMAEEAVDVIAVHDPLTSLPNRQLFTEAVDVTLEIAMAKGARLAILMIDLAGFRPINDRYGQVCANQVLIEFARRAAAIVGSSGYVARFGDDDFAVLMPEIHSLDEPMRLAGPLVAEASIPFTIGGHRVTLGAEVGIAVAPDNGHSSDELIRRAQLALRWAKAQGRSSIRCFKPEMDADVVRRTRIERELRAGAADAITVNYQPLVRLDDGSIFGFEALARWTDRVLGPIAPDVFIPVAEECGLINDLGDRLLRTACRDATTWPAHLILAFNISPIQLCEPTLGLRLLAILGETGLDPRRLEIEVTESALVENIEVAQRVIDQLRHAGVRVALDDFGTGYATMSQLLALRLDKIKIDRSFVGRLGQDKESIVIVRAIMSLAGAFGLTTTAEGIEDAEQLACLKANDCSEGQGFLFSKAIPADDVAKLLDGTQTLAAQS